MKSSSQNRIRVLLRKEWLEMKHNRMLLGTAVGTPLCMFLSMFTMYGGLGDATGKHSPQTLKEIGVVMGERAALFTHSEDATSVYIGEMGLMLLLLLPGIVPAILAATTIVREKQSKSLESLLTTPVRTWELVVAKQLFCNLVGLLPAGFCIAAFYLMLHYTVSAFAFSMLASPAWLITILVTGPLLALLATSFSIAVSARAKDVQSAQQLAGLLTLPLIAIMALQSTGVAVLSTNKALVLAATIAVLDVVAVIAAVSLFERETILTRWR